MDSYLIKIIRQDLQDFQDFFLPFFRLPAIASRSGEAGGEEKRQTPSPSAKKLIPTYQ